MATNRRRIEIEVKKLEALLKDFESSKSELEKVQAEDLTDKARERRVLMEKMERQVNQAREVSQAGPPTSALTVMSTPFARPHCVSPPPYPIFTPSLKNDMRHDRL